MAKKKSLYTFDVFLIGGPITRDFVKKNSVVSRTIQIRGDRTLEDLHDIIFDAFDRFDPHMYEFQIGGKGPMDPEADKYVLPMAMHGPFAEEEAAGIVTQTTLESLGLKIDEVFGYWFDYGDDWWHQINVVAIDDGVPRGKYPKITKAVGESPPQYIDWEEEALVE